jgi:hypothetical protein
MSSEPRRGCRLIGIVVLVLALAGCGSAGAKATSNNHQPAATGGSTTSSSEATAAGQTPSTSTGGGSSSSSGHGQSSTPSSTSPPAATGPGPAATGTYTYDQSGSLTAGGSSQQFPPQGTIVVDAASADGADSWIQVWHSYLDTSEPPSNTTFATTPSGIAITSEVIQMSADGQTISFTCAFSSPVQVIDWPPTVGHQFSGSTKCTSPNNSYGSFTVSLSGSVSGTQPTSDGGSPATAYVVSTKATTSGSVTSTTTETDWFDPGPDIDLYQSSQQSGNYEGLVSFSSMVTRTLVSTHPS